MLTRLKPPKSAFDESGRGLVCNHISFNNDSELIFAKQYFIQVLLKIQTLKNIIFILQPETKKRMDKTIKP